MITIECGNLPGCSKLEEIKAIQKLRLVDGPIRINKNIARNLEASGLIRCKTSGDKYSTYELTSKGKSAKLMLESFQLTLDAYLRIQDVSKWVAEITKRRKFVFKIMITTCFACGKERDRHNLEHIQDDQGNDGMYCKSCLKRGYAHALSQMKERKNVVSSGQASASSS